MNNITQIDLAQTIVARWRHVLTRDEMARRGSEAALRRRDAVGAPRWIV